MSEPAISALVVEDEVLIGLMVEEALSDIGFVVTLCSKGEAAMDALRSGASYRLLVTDIRLGTPADGWVVAKAARESQPDIQVIYMTGDSMDDWRSQGVPESVLLAKPFLPAQIATAATTLLNRPEAQSL